jgi:hypothetical protein
VVPGRAFTFRSSVSSPPHALCRNASRSASGTSTAASKISTTSICHCLQLKGIS